MQIIIPDSDKANNITSSAQQQMLTKKRCGTLCNP